MKGKLLVSKGGVITVEIEVRHFDCGDASMH